MSDLDPRSSFVAPDWQYSVLPITAPFDVLIDINQLTSNSSPNITQQGHGGNPFQAHIESRDLGWAATPAVSDPCSAWAGLAYSRSDMGGTGNGNLTGITTPFISQRGFQSWATQQALGAEAWEPIFDPHCVPSLDPNPIRSFDSISRNHEYWVGQICAQPLSNLPAQPNGGEISTDVHGIHHTGQGIYCQQCDSQFSTRALLECHAKESQHSPYRCRCGKTFSRLDVLHRHIQTFQPEVSYPCPHCKKRRGPRAFVRLDHLTQHLRGYHNIESVDESEVAHSQKSSRKRKTKFSCPHETCSHPSGMASLPDEPAMHRTFLTRGEFTKHLREVHDESLFPCVEMGCCRIGGRGFFRKKDLLNHVKEHHTDAEFQPSAI